MKTVYFVRHGESEANIAPVFQSPDSPLSEKGKQQAESIARRVSKLTFDALISSPFQRAKETAEAIQKTTGKEPEFSKLFTECVKPTSINDKPYTDISAEKIWRKWQESLHTPGLKVEDGENFDDLIKRADEALLLLESRDEQSIVVVTHGYFLRVIIARVLLGDLMSGEILRKFKRFTSTENTGITVLRYHDAFEEEACWRLWIYNDHAHLAD